MKKIIIILIIIAISVIGYLFFKKNQLRNKIIKANIEIICYEQAYRLSVPLMMSDKKTKEEIKDGIQVIVSMQNEVAKKYGYLSFNEFSIIGSQKFNNKEQAEIEIEIVKKVRETCAPEYNKN